MLETICSYPYWVQALPISGMIYIGIRFFPDDEDDLDNDERPKAALVIAAISFVFFWALSAYTGHCLR
jgi:hypothetical protein